MESEGVKKLVEKEILKINLYGEQIKEAIDGEEIETLNRLCGTTVPNKLKALEDLIEKTSEMMIDEEETIGAVQAWTKGTKNSFKEALELFAKGKAVINECNVKLNELAKKRTEDEERKNREEERKEMWEYEEFIRREKFEKEKAAWILQQKNMIETKEKEMEIERKAKQNSANLPTLSIAPFKGTPKDWIRFSNQFKSQIDSQQLIKVVKLGYLLQCVRGECHELLGNIPYNNEGYDRALQILKEEHGQEKTVLAAHTREIIELQAVKGIKYSKIKEFYDILRINHEALRQWEATYKLRV